MKKLKIAQLVLPWIALPPAGYAGTERVVHVLTEELVKRGHKVTLFSVGETKTSAYLRFIYEKALGLQADVMTAQKSSFKLLSHVAECFRRENDFDIIHSHAQFLGLPFAAVSKIPSVHTFHRVLDFENPDETELVKRFGYLNFVSISNHQRIPEVNFVATVYNGVDSLAYHPAGNPTRDYLFWSGRFIEKKGPREAIAVARVLGIKLIMAGTITEQSYFDTYIKPEIDGKNIQVVGEITQAEMIKLYQNARLTLFPIKWNEPFGLVPIESMMCGTPVVCYNNGGVAETVKDGVGGYLVDKKGGADGLIIAAKKIVNASSADYAKLCTDARTHAASHFSIEKMVEGYGKVYQKILHF